jgi:hypothetical protein
MVWIDDDHFSGWCCPDCQWAISPIRLDTTIATLQFNRSAQAGFEKHDCVPNPAKPKVRAQAAGAKN